MKPIEFDIWESNPEKPGTVRRVGQRRAEEVFAELQHRLESTGYLPDEYFLMDSHWNDGVEIPENTGFYCVADYGASEGIYLDIYFKWYNKEQEQYITKKFATGKTHGETGSDLDRMNLTASAVTKAFNGDGGTYARYIRMGGSDEPGGVIMHLNSDERRLLIESLVESRNQMLQDVGILDQILRRATGSILEYVNEVGGRPLHMSVEDQAVLAIQEGDIPSFNDAYGKIEDGVEELLVMAAGRPGTVGKKITTIILGDSETLPNEIYLEACKKAVDIADGGRVQLLMEQAQYSVENLELRLYGDVISHAYYKGHIKMAGELIHKSNELHIKASNPRILAQALEKGDYTAATTLVKKQINADSIAGELPRAAHIYRNDWMFEHLLKSGMEIKSDNYTVLHECINVGNVAAANLLLDQGMSYERYREWSQDKLPSDFEALGKVEEYWNSLSQLEQDTGPTLGGM